MPSYDLVCKDCGQKFSVFCSISAKDKQICPKCTSTDISQRFTAVNIGGSRSGNTVSSSSISSSGSGFG